MRRPRAPLWRSLASDTLLELRAALRRALRLLGQEESNGRIRRGACLSLAAPAAGGAPLSAPALSASLAADRVERLDATCRICHT